MRSRASHNPVHNSPICSSLICGATQFLRLAQLKRQRPATGVLLVVSQLEPALMLEAMRAGVNECVVDPVAVPELQAAVKRLRIWQRLRVVKSSHSSAPRAVLARRPSQSTLRLRWRKQPRTRPLLIDLNVACGDAAVFLGAEPRFSVMDALENIQRLDAAFFGGLVVRSKSGLDLLGASGRPVNGALDAARIRTLLDVASQTRRYTVLDVPRSDTAALESLEVATKIVLVANQELATVRSAARLATTLKQRYGQAGGSAIVSGAGR